MVATGVHFDCLLEELGHSPHLEVCFSKRAPRPVIQLVPVRIKISLVLSAVGSRNKQDGSATRPANAVGVPQRSAAVAAGQ